MQWAYYAFNFTLFDKARQTFSIFSSTSYPNLTKILFICPWVMFNSRIHFRTNTFDILSHLADRQTTDARYIYMHACSTVELLT